MIKILAKCVGMAIVDLLIMAAICFIISGFVFFVTRDVRILWIVIAVAFVGAIFDRYRAERRYP